MPKGRGYGAPKPLNKYKTPSGNTKSPNLGKQVGYLGADPKPIYGKKVRSSAGDGANERKKK